VVKRTKASGKKRRASAKAPAEHSGKDLRTKQLMVRVTPDEKRLLIQAAHEQGDSLSNWLRKLAMRSLRGPGQRRLTGR